MIITITPNPAMDESYATDGFQAGRWYRAKSVLRSPGGKGVNVSIILRQLGYDSVTTGFLAGHTGAYIRDDLLARGITTNFVNIRGENRTNTFIKDETCHIETAMTEDGPTVCPDAIQRFFWNLERILPRATAVHMGGSLPPGAPSEFFRDAVDRARRKNIPVYVDASGESLDLAATALPTVVKIDRRFDGPARDAAPDSAEHLMAVSKRIFDEGVDWIVTSRSNSSNIFCTTKGFYQADIKADFAVTYRAASDALMAGMIAARAEHMSIEDIIRFSMACVIQTVCSPQKGLPSRAAVEASLDDVTIQKI
jgi:1-phosphofructokinase family hexose kinase